MELKEILLSEPRYHDIDWFEEKAEEGNVDAQFETGVYYYLIHNNSETMDGSKKAYKWLESAAKNGHKQAMHTLGHLLKYGYGEVPKNEEESEKWINKAQNYGINDWVDLKTLLQFNEYKKGYDQKDLDATVRLAICLEEDNEDYLKYLSEAVEKGSGLAAWLIGCYYSRENNYNEESIAKYFYIAAERGNRSAKARVMEYLIKGKYVEQDVNKAFDYGLEVSGQSKDKWNKNLADFLLGELCLFYRSELNNKPESLTDPVWFFRNYLVNSHHGLGNVNERNASEMAEITIPHYMKWLKYFPNKEYASRSTTFGGMADVLSKPQPFGLSGEYMIQELFYK